MLIVYFFFVDKLLMALTGLNWLCVLHLLAWRWCWQINSRLIDLTISSTFYTVQLFMHKLLCLVNTTRWGLTYNLEADDVDLMWGASECCVQADQVHYLPNIDMNSHPNPRHQLWVRSSGTSQTVCLSQSTCNHFTPSSNCDYTNSSFRRCAVSRVCTVITLVHSYIHAPTWLSCRLVNIISSCSSKSIYLSVILTTCSNTSGQLQDFGCHPGLQSLFRLCQLLILVRCKLGPRHLKFTSNFTNPNPNAITSRSWSSLCILTSCILSSTTPTPFNLCSLSATIVSCPSLWNSTSPSIDCMRTLQSLSSTPLSLSIPASLPQHYSYSGIAMMPRPLCSMFLHLTGMSPVSLG